MWISKEYHYYSMNAISISICSVLLALIQALIDKKIIKKIQGKDLMHTCSQDSVQDIVDNYNYTANTVLGSSFYPNANVISTSDWKQFKLVRIQVNL